MNCTEATLSGYSLFMIGQFDLDEVRAQFFVFGRRHVKTCYRIVVHSFRSPVLLRIIIRISKRFVPGVVWHNYCFAH